jgi:tetratricopeptide (TPR) repeat protein
VVPLLDRWARADQFDRSARLLERIARIEDGGHLRAIEQLVETRKAEGNRATVARTVERLVRAYQAKGLTAKVASQLETLKLFDPTSPLLFLGRAANDPPPTASAAHAAPAGPAASAAPEAPAVSDLEVPAVPLGPADLEFVSGNLTEAEVFEKYGLHREAVAQLRQITSRFPGHVVAQEKLVGFLRTQTDRGALRDGLVALALAKRAAGDTEGARRAAREAAGSAVIERSVRAVLEGFALLPAEAPLPASAPAPAPKAAPPPAAKAPPPPANAPPPAAARAPGPPRPASMHDEPEELEILFDDVEETPEAAASIASDTIEEIEFYLGQGMNQDALNRIAEARRAGSDGAVLDALEARARAATVPYVEDSGGGDDRLDEDDLSSITAALEAEYGTDRVPDLAEPPTEPESEQSVDEVFESFKEQVNASVDVADYRTHYDLGIAYKEMGLSEDALAEFRIASGTPELYREACSMLGLCHWDRGETEEAIRWYRAALDAPGSEEDRLSGLRYDLADRLEQTGDVRGAYDQFAQVLREEPGYRDVDRRVAALRSKLGL